MWFRISLLASSFTALVFWGWLATKVSAEPSILGRYSPSYFCFLLLSGICVGLSFALHLPIVYKRLFKVRSQLALGLGTTLVTLAGVELLVRYLDPLGISYLSEVTRYSLDRVADPDVVFRHQPGLRKTYQGVEVSFNEIGLRDRPLVKPAEHEFRVLLLGDSVTFGWGVSIDDTFGRQLEALLTKKIGRPVKTINTGVCGYNTVQEAALLEQLGDKIEPNLVMLLYVGNDTGTNRPPYDPWAERSLSGKSPPEVIRQLARRLWLYRLVAFAIENSKRRTPAAPDLSDASKWTSSEGFRESMEALRKIARWCNERRIPLVTFVYRTKYMHPDGLHFLRLEIAQIAEQNSFAVCDIRSWWEPFEMSQVTNSVVDTHPNAKGHQIIAQGIAQYLGEERLVFPDKP